MNKHTRGSWAILPDEDDREYIRIRGTVLGGRYKIANVLSPNYLKNYPELAQKELEESRANAQLIAAAPDLLEALKAMLVEFNEQIPGVVHDELAAIANARAAIEKATS